MISRSILEALVKLAPVASKDPHRPHVQTVLIIGEPNRATLVATDGHKIVRRILREVECPEGRYLFQTRNLQLLKKILADNKGRETFANSSPFEQEVAVGWADGQSFALEKDNRRYPDISEIIPPRPLFQKASIVLNAEYLLQIAKAFQQHKRHESRIRIEFDPTSSTNPVTVSSLEDEDSIAVIMPVRDDRSRIAAETLRAALTPMRESSL